METRAHVALVITNRTDRHALTTWRTYNAGTLVEQQIKELYRMGMGATAVDDLGGNAVLAALTRVACQPLHVLRTTALRVNWRAQPARLRAWILRVPAVHTTHARRAPCSGGAMSRTAPCSSARCVSSPPCHRRGRACSRSPERRPIPTSDP
jgi:hypothetical protein